MNEFEYKINWSTKQRHDVEVDRDIMVIKKSILDIYMERFEKLKTVILTLNGVYLPFSIVLIVLGSIRYVNNYLTKDQYQNYVIG
jgi:hypothetical protein